jgi:hypothetical protein
MTVLHRRSTTLTIPVDADVVAPDVARYDEDDITVYPVSSVGRLTQLKGVTITNLVGSPQLVVRELEADDGNEESGEPGYSDEEYPGRQLLYIAQPDERTYWTVETETADLAVDEDGAAVSAEYRPPIVGTRQVRVELTGLPGDSLTVALIYETAGDQRF